MTTATEAKNWILNRAAEDSEFRARLLADAKEAISTEFGMPIRHGLDFVVHEDSANTIHLVLPSSPELTEAELEMVTGGNPPTPSRPIGAPGDWAS